MYKQELNCPRNNLKMATTFDSTHSYMMNKGDMNKVYKEYEAYFVQKSNYLFIKQINEDKNMTKKNKKLFIDKFISQGNSFCEECECNADTNDLITTYSFNEEKQLCQECVDGGDYNICHDCGDHYFCDYGITKCNDNHLYDFCNNCYECNKSEIDEEFDESDDEDCQ